VLRAKGLGRLADAEKQKRQQVAGVTAIKRISIQELLYAMSNSSSRRKWVVGEFPVGPRLGRTLFPDIEPGTIRSISGLLSRNLADGAIEAFVGRLLRNRTLFNYSRAMN